MSKNAVCYIVIAICLCTTTCLAKYSGGTGDSNDPYLIATPADLNTIGTNSNDWDKHFKMVADINMAGYTFTTAVIAPDTSSYFEFQGTAFTGSFDGNNHTISNLVIDTNGIGNDYLGLFGKIDSGSEVRNLGLLNMIVNGGEHSRNLGGLVGWIWLGTISQCYATGSVSSGDYSVCLGGLVGESSHGTISLCYAACSVSGERRSENLGGLVGEFFGSFKISHCYAVGPVSGGRHSEALGGLVGDNQYGTIIQCYATGSVSGGDLSVALGGLVGSEGGTMSYCYSTGSVSGGDDSSYLGGLVGSNNWLASGRTISHCYATGFVNGGNYSVDLGGLVGFNSGTISECYAAGPVIGHSSSNLGGLVGNNYKIGDHWYGTIGQCYAVGSVTGDSSSNLGGLVGWNHDPSIVEYSFWDIETSDRGTSTGGFGLPTAQMQKRSTFADAGWDMANVWDIGENQTYPFLRTHLPSDINKDDETNFFDLAILTENWLAEK